MFHWPSPMVCTEEMSNTSNLTEIRMDTVRTVRREKWFIIGSIVHNEDEGKRKEWSSKWNEGIDHSREIQTERMGEELGNRKEISHLSHCNIYVK